MKNLFYLFILLFSSFLQAEISKENLQDRYNKAKSLSKTNADTSLKIFKEILAYSKNEKISKLSFIAIEEIANTYFFDSKLDSAIYYYKIVLDNFIEKKDTNKIASTKNLIGNAYRKKGELINALEIYEESKKDHISINEQKGLSYVFNNLGLTYLKMLSFKKAIESFKKSLEIKEDLNDSAGIAKTTGNIGLAFSELGEPKSAIKYYERSYKVLRNLKDSFNIPIVLNHLAGAFQNTNNLDTALKIYRRSLEYSQKLNLNVIAATSLMGLSEINIEYSDLYSAESYAKEAQKILSNNSGKFELINSYLLLAKINSLKNEKEEFFENYQTALRLMKNKDYKKLKSKLYFLAYENNLDNKNFENALANYKLYSEIKEEIKDDEFRLSKAKLDLDMKQRINEANMESLLKIKDKIENDFITQKKFMYIMFIVFLILLIILVYVIKLFVEKKRLSEELEQTIYSKNKFFSIIAHDLKGPISAFKVLTSQMHDYFHEFSVEEQKEFTLEISKQSEDMYKLLENLLTWSRIETGDLKFYPDNFDLKFLLDNVLQRFERKLKEKEISINSDVKENQFVYFDIQGLDIVINNIISNAIKYSFEKSKIYIKLERNMNFWVLLVQDYGSGISKSVLENIKNPKKRIVRSGTKNERGTGLGIIVSKSIMEQNGGEILFYSEPDKGTKVKIRIPRK